jgi:hypothetical protein
MKLLLLLPALVVAQILQWGALDDNSVNGFGAGIFQEGPELLIGAPNLNAVYVYKKTPYEWEFRQKIVAPDSTQYH